MATRCIITTTAGTFTHRDFDLVGRPVQIVRQYGKQLNGFPLYYAIADPVWRLDLILFDLTATRQNEIISRIGTSATIVTADSEVGRSVAGQREQPRWLNATMSNVMLLGVRFEKMGPDVLAGNRLRVECEVLQSDLAWAS